VISFKIIVCCHSREEEREKHIATKTMVDERKNTSAADETALDGGGRECF
jgi:hypothetical protein